MNDTASLPATDPIAATMPLPKTHPNTRPFVATSPSGTAAELTNAERAVAFAAAVRSQLNDLPADELDELLDGLGADLEERLNDGGELGDPTGYAEELRQAAGLPPRDPKSAPQLPLRERIAAARARAASWFAATPARRSVRDFAVAVQPTWWVLRALVGAWAALLLLRHPLINGLPISYLSVAFTLALIMLSVQWGRGRWLPRAWLTHVRRVANVAAVVLVLPFLASTLASLTTPHTDYSYEEYAMQGLARNGGEITNIFAYDCEGNLLESVRLYDQNGEPLTTLSADASTPPDSWVSGDDRSYAHSFNPLAKDAEVWNVFPLSAATYSDVTGEPGEPSPAKPPKDELPPLSRDCSAETTADEAAAEPDETEAGAESTNGATTAARTGE